MPSLSPFLFLIFLIISSAFDPDSNGSPYINFQWSNTHYGKAYPWVKPLKWAANPKDSETGKCECTIIKGVP